MKRFDDTVAVITGAASGIGLALAGEFAAAGSRIAMVDLDAHALAAAEKRLQNSTRHVSTHIADVGNAVQMERMAQRVVDHHGRVDILVNNAGVSLAGPLETLSPEDIEWITRTNLLGVVYPCRYLLPVLRDRPCASIVNILSDFGLIGFPTKSMYCATKFAGRGFSEALRAECAGSSVCVTEVYPPAVGTSLVVNGRCWNEDARTAEAEFLSRRALPVGRVAKRILVGIRKRKPRVYIGRDTRMIELARRISPRASEIVATRQARRLPFVTPRA